MIARFTNGGATTTISQASGGNDGPNWLTLGAIGVAGWFVWDMVMN